jgi:FdhD protein
MPLAHIDFLRSFLARAEGLDAPAVVARTPGKVQPLFGIYARSLLSAIEKALGEGRLSVTEFLESIDAHYIEVPKGEAARLRDIDGPADLPLLAEAFEEVEPLPVRSLAMTRFGGHSDGLDLAAAEVPVGVFANGARLATVMCLPNAIRELALGFVRYLGLVRSVDDVASIAVDHDAARANLELFADAAKIRNAVRLLVTSTCGANVYGEQLPDLSVGEKDGPRISRTHILETISRLRPMAPVFEKTGCTHQAAWTDGESVRFFFEDVGRHNAVDKIVGAAMLRGSDLGRGALVTTGRLNGEIVVKAVRARVPVLASRGAATTNAVRLAGNYGLTLVGFARAGRVNVYSSPERIADE